MLKFTGTGVYNAIAEGRITLLTRHSADISPARCDNTSVELSRLEAAKAEAVSQLMELCEKAKTELSEKEAEIFEIHTMLIEDEDYCAYIENAITADHYTAEYAVQLASDSFAALFSAMDDEYMRERSADIRDISDRLLRCLTKCGETQLSLHDRMIICAEDLSPSETISLDRSRVAAFVTADGGVTSHTAILARSLGIPAVVGVGREFLSELSAGGEAIVDGGSGTVYLSPDDDTRSELLQKQTQLAAEKQRLKALKGLDNITADGRRIDIYANIGCVDDVKAALQNDAGGIGLMRSEFLYLGRSSLPTEDEQFAQYSAVLKKMNGRRVIIRTLDIGADKQVDYLGLKQEQNPALGLRAIRLCLSQPEIFITQLRALYRASVHGKLGIMFPMITSEWEVIKILSLCDEVKKQLKADGIPYSEDVEIGIMIETPAAAIISDLLCPMVDFVSIGTSDLTQYTLACDRQNTHLSEYCNPHHTAVLRLIELSAENAHKNGAWIGICGELAADKTLTETFLRMGIDELSVSPSFILPLREHVRKTGSCEE